MGRRSDDPSVLHAEAVGAIADPANTVWFTSASAWELAINVRGGKLSVDVDKLVDQLTRSGIRLLGIGIDDAIAARSLDWAHRDPFDRMIVAQACRQGLRVITRDIAIQTFLASTFIICLSSAVCTRPVGP